MFSDVTIGEPLRPQERLFTNVQVLTGATGHETEVGHTSVTGASILVVAFFRLLFTFTAKRSSFLLPVVLLRPFRVYSQHAAVGRRCPLAEPQWNAEYTGALAEHSQSWRYHHAGF